MAQSYYHSTPSRNGTGALPVIKEVKQESKHRKVKLFILPTAEAVEELKQYPDDTNTILHVTC